MANVWDEYWEQRAERQQIGRERGHSIGDYCDFVNLGTEPSLVELPRERDSSAVDITDEMVESALLALAMYDQGWDCPRECVSEIYRRMRSVALLEGKPCSKNMASRLATGPGIGR